MKIIRIFRLFKIDFHLNLVETFVAPSIRQNLISILDKFGYACSLRDDKLSLPYDSNVVRYRSLVVNLYLLDIERSHNELLQIESQGTTTNQNKIPPLYGISVNVMSLNKNSRACVEENSWTLMFRTLIQMIVFPTTHDTSIFGHVQIIEVEIQHGKKIKAVKYHALWRILSFV